jgi:hypothetical protein
MRKTTGAIAVMLTFALGALGWSLYTPDLPVESLRTRWAPAPSQFRAVDGLSVHLRDEGVATDRSGV